MIKYKDRFKQSIDFSGVGSDKIHPTDIDAILEFNDRYLFMFEVKLKGVEVPVGQKLALERIADSWEETKGPAFVVYCEHNTDPSEIIQITNCYTKSFYRKGKIREFENHSVKDFLSRVARVHKITKLQNSL